jgi:hypothetical protein
VTTYPCPKGHVSSESDFCDTCGTRIDGGSPPTVPLITAPADQPAAPAKEKCPNCGYPRSGPFRFCEDCGYDHSTGRFPVGVLPQTIELTPPQVRIGRRSVSKGTMPEIDLAAEPADPGVSHNHALLTFSIDGVWLVSDVGSSNGTWINDEDQPLTAGQSRTLKDGDQVHVGAWTTITLRAPVV